MCFFTDFFLLVAYEEFLPELLPLQLHQWLALHVLAPKLAKVASCHHLGLGGGQGGRPAQNQLSMAHQCALGVCPSTNV